MRRIRFRQLTAILFMALMLPHCAAFAMEHIERAESGQMVFIDADNGLSYTADFYLSAVDELRRDADSLHIYTGGEITLKGFFSCGREARILMFADGRSVSGADFDASGGFTGSYISGTSGEKKNQDLRVEYAQDPETSYDYEVRRDSGGLSVLKDGTAVHGEIKQRCTEKYAALFGSTEYAPAVCLSNSFFLREDEDGTLTAVRQTLKAPDGYTVVSTAPEVVCAVGAGKISAVGEGRAVLNYSNGMNAGIASLSFRVVTNGKDLTVGSICPQCGENTAGAIHLAPCGHYRCSAEYDENHAVADCGIAGHCRVSDIEHGKCRNCLGYLCDGKLHGTGYCAHVHEWFCVSYVPPTIDVPGTSVSICLTCGQSLTQTIG